MPEDASTSLRLSVRILAQKGKISKVRVFCFTSDRYLPMVRLFAHQFCKHFSTEIPVVVVGFSRPTFNLPDNFSFVSLGDQRGYPVERWSNAVIKFLNSVDDQAFLFCLEDFLIQRPVFVKEVYMLYDYAIQHKYTLKVDLFTDRRYAGGVTDYGFCGHIPLVKSDPASQYSFSLMCGIWNTELMLKFMRPDETPWDAELRGTPRVAAAGDSVLVIGTKSWTDDPSDAPIRHILANRSGQPEKYLLDDLSSEDVAELRVKGYIP